MNIVKHLFKSFFTLFSWFYKTKKIKSVTVDDIPEHYKKGTIYIVGEDDPWYAIMVCPCGCGEIIRLCLQDEVSPSWELRYHRCDGTVSLHPSVWRTNGCQSHFFLTQGCIEWCK